LRQRTDAYYQRGERMYYEGTAQRLVLLKKQEETVWLNDVSSVPLQQALRHLDKAFRNFFDGRANYPTFKKKRNQQAATYANNAFIWKDQALTLAKMDAPLSIVWHRPLPDGCKPSSVTVTKDEAERYFVSILVEEDIKALEVSPKTVGLDLGLKSMVITSDGHTYGNPKFFSKNERKLAKAQRRHAIKKKGSKNRNKARLKVARIHKKISDRRYPSSKRCFDCGHLLDSLPLDVRLWACPECGVVHDRDINAAQNILAAGLAVAACGEAVRPGAVKTKPGKPQRNRKAYS
jgi:putative transposase